MAKKRMSGAGGLEKRQPHASYWRREIEICSVSDLSQVEFCRWRGLSLSALRWWKWKLKIERCFAHCYESVAMRRLHLRDHPNILKRLLIHIAGFNLGLLMRELVEIGKPRVLQGCLAILYRTFMGRVVLSEVFREGR